MIGRVDGRLFTAVFTWRGDLPRFISGEGATKVKNEPTALPADPHDPEDFDVSPEALDRASAAA